ncbi:chalcone isomerase family protein [bacterium]|nr:chalcone isomerase family protein [bacterium]
MPFRGGHLLEWWSLDVYTAAFYAPMDTKTYDELLDAKTPRRIVLRYHRSIDAEDIEKATRKGIKKNSNVDRRALEERLKKLYACYADVEEGDEYRIDYDPEARETSIYFNGELSCTIEGEDFAAAFFAIWTSTYALDSEMSESLTGMKQ